MNVALWIVQAVLAPPTTYHALQRAANVQVAELDDMTESYQRVKELVFDMALSVGQHTNDKELSHYALTPSGFEWKLGWNPIVVDESTWEPTTHQGISI